MSQCEVVYYEKADGSAPAEEFILSQPYKMQAKIARTVELLEDYGNSLRLPYSRNIGDGIFELRSKVGSDISRVMYFFMVGNRAVLTNGFVKKTQKTPSGVIELAKKYRQDFYDRGCDKL